MDKFAVETLIYLLIKYLHLVALLVLFSSALARYVLVTQDDTNRHKLHLARELGAASLISVFVLLVSGALLVAWAGLGSPVYLGNRFFQVKMVLFVLALVLMLACSRFIRKNAMERSYGWVQVPGYVRWFQRLEILMLLTMIAAALLMTHGFGAARLPG